MQGHARCPMRGKRAPDLATGEVWRFLETAWNSAFADLTVECVSVLSAMQWAALVQDYNRGKAHCTYVLTLKLQPWSLLPWLLCGLSHPREALAREVGARALA
eukprot:3412977-Alexandrium_andersonii.AAC.1